MNLIMDYIFPRLHEKIPSLEIECNYSDDQFTLSMFQSGVDNGPYDTWEVVTKKSKIKTTILIACLKVLEKLK